MLTHWVKQQGLPLEWAVQKLTSLPAEMMGLKDRGVIKQGMKADLNIIDLDRLEICFLRGFRSSGRWNAIHAGLRWISGYVPGVSSAKANPQACCLGDWSEVTPSSDQTIEFKNNVIQVYIPKH